MAPLHSSIFLQLIRSTSTLLTHQPQGPGDIRSLVSTSAINALSISLCPALLYGIHILTALFGEILWYYYTVRTHAVMSVLCIPVPFCI